MPRQTSPVEVSSFVQGLITEASPLTFPENASLAEDNFNLRRDGSRDRRLGINLESDFQEVTTGTSAPSPRELAVSSFSWENAGGVPEKTLAVIQTGRVVKVFDTDTTPLSAGEVFTTEFPAATSQQTYSYAVVDGLLVIATGAKPVRVLDYRNGNISVSNRTLKIRDQFGVEATVDGRDLFDGLNLAYRPEVLTNRHTYNLRNQTWGLPKENSGDGRNQVDTISNFHSADGAYPSNADNINYALYPDVNDESNRTGDQFFPRDLFSNPPGTFPAPKGFFIIDALERGASRLEEATQLYEDNPVLNFPIETLPQDRTPGGATCVAEYAGRVWYAGFSGEVIDGDNRSPRLSSYVFYSKLVQSQSDIANCYQEGDPTSKENPDLLDTDGGFIRIDGAFNIQKLVNVGSGVMVVAENGVWMITGGSDYGFTANNHMRRKITERGVQSPGSVVVVDNTFMFWSDDAIYHIKPDQFGDWQAQNLTQTTIQKFYDEIDPVDKYHAQGGFDSYDSKVRWVYQDSQVTPLQTRELIFDTILGAFYTHTVKGLDGSPYPYLAAPLEVPPFRIVDQQVDVVADADPVVVEGGPVVYNAQVRGAQSRELAYVTLLSTAPVRYSFSLYRDVSFRDWVSVDGEGVDAPAFLVTGYLSGGDFMRYKQVPYVYFHLRKTEEGFQQDSSGNVFASNESSCLVQAQWEWTNSPNGNRWGRPFQAYRHRRLYMPASSADTYDNGVEVVTTKNKLRGKGKVLSLKISTEPDKDLRLLGWSMLVGVAGNV